MQHNRTSDGAHFPHWFVQMSPLIGNAPFDIMCFLTINFRWVGKIQEDRKKFPRGIRYIADTLHAKGLKLGVYTDLSNHGCGSGPGSMGHVRTTQQSAALVEVCWPRYLGNLSDRLCAGRWRSMSSMPTSSLTTGRPIT